MKSSPDSAAGSAGSSTADPRTPRLKLRLVPQAETAVRGGHPWVFAGSIREQNREGESGEIAVIYDGRDALLALGLYDPDSPIRVTRVASWQGEESTARGGADDLRPRWQSARDSSRRTPPAIAV